MKILIVSQYFWPEYFRINDLVEELAKKNHQIDILTGHPNYPRGEIYNDFKKDRSLFNEFKGCKIYRVPIIPRKKDDKEWHDSHVTIKNGKKTNNVNNAKKIYDLHIKNNI
jgi:hypothetical protein